METIVSGELAVAEIPELKQMHDRAQQPQQAPQPLSPAEAEIKRQALCRARKANITLKEAEYAKRKSESVAATAEYEAWKSPQTKWEKARDAEKEAEGAVDVAKNGDNAKIRELYPAGLRKALAVVEFRRDEMASPATTKLHQLAFEPRDITADIAAVLAEVAEYDRKAAVAKAAAIAATVGQPGIGTGPRLVENYPARPIAGT